MSRMSPSRSLCATVATLAIGGMLLSPGFASAQSPFSQPQTVRVETGAGAARSLSLPRGRSAIVELPVDARDVMVSDPKVADVVLSTPRRIYVMGQASGQTDALFVDGMGRQILRLSIRVDQDAAAVAETMARLLPGALIRVESANDSLILSGEAANIAEADRALRLAQSFVPDKTKVVNLISIAGSEQVMLKVKIVEVNRTVIKQLGFDLGAITGQLGMPQYSILNSATYGVAGTFLGSFTGGYKYDSTKQPFFNPVYTDASGARVVSPEQVQTHDWKLAGIKEGAGSKGVNSAEAMIQAFERVGLIRTLAEPNLTAISGESAKFLAGGEFPVPIGQDNNGRVTVEFKPYGVGLGFTPVVLGPGRISLKLSTEVSELTSLGSFTLGNGTGGGLSIPGLNVRRAETVVELPSGGAMMIAGLMQSQTKQTLDSLPGLMQLPILGSLFRSRDFQNNESELVIIVTPYLVKSTRPDQLQTPADGLAIANDLETNLLGRVNSGFGKKPQAVANKTYQGPFGYVVD